MRPDGPSLPRVLHHSLWRPLALRSHTPLRKKVVQGNPGQWAWLEAAKLLRHPFILVLWLVTFADSFVHNCYFNWTGRFLGTGMEEGGVGIAGNWIMPVMSVGQVAEFVTMLVLGVALKKLGWRWTMVVGVLGACRKIRGLRLFPSVPGTHHSHSGTPRRMLRLLFCHGLHFCRRLFSQGRPGQRPGVV